MNSQLLTKYSDLVKEYMLTKYVDNDDGFINTESEEECYESFTDEIFNCRSYVDFHQFVIDDDIDFSSKEILFLLNWANQYFEDNFGAESKLSIDLTEEKIANSFAYAYMRDNYDELLEYMKENISDSISVPDINPDINPELNPEQ
jgi:hypothetical protein